jgi:hypothetical protein
MQGFSPGLILALFASQLLPPAATSCVTARNSPEVLGT